MRRPEGQNFDCLVSALSSTTRLCLWLAGRGTVSVHDEGSVSAVPGGLHLVDWIRRMPRLQRLSVDCDERLPDWLVAAFFQLVVTMPQLAAVACSDWFETFLMHVLSIAGAYDKNRRMSAKRCWNVANRSGPSRLISCVAAVFSVLSCQSRVAFAERTGQSPAKRCPISGTAIPAPLQGTMAGETSCS